MINITHRRLINLSKQTPIPARFQPVFHWDGFPATWEVHPDAQTLELLKKNLPCLLPQPTQWGISADLLISKWLKSHGEMEVSIPGLQTASTSN